MNPEPKSRTVTCRLTAEEYERFLNLSPLVGSRNVSELARIAINAFLQQPVEEGSASLESRVADLEERVQLLSRDFQRITSVGDGARGDAPEPKSMLSLSRGN
jgi:hypothetical protein